MCNHNSIAIEYVMKTKSTIIFILFSIQLFGQNKQLKDFGFRHLQTFFQGDTVDILIQSKKGEELISKPVFLFCQGSLPIPLIKTHGNNIYGVFPFNTNSLLEKFHLVIISKPFIPLIAADTILVDKFCYIDKQTGKTPKEYSKRNLLDYYVERNIKAIDFLQGQKFINTKSLIVAGHSQGGAIVAKMASKSKKITHVIFASENPFGQIMSIIQEYRSLETDTDSTRYCEDVFNYWGEIVEDKDNMDDTNGDTFKSTYVFSIPPFEYLNNLKIPVLVCYGTKDFNSPFNDFLRVEMIRQKRRNFTFISYVGRDHNYFGFKPNGQVDFDNFGWDKVAADWLTWLTVK